jgi:putative transposase
MKMIRFSSRKGIRFIEGAQRGWTIIRRLVTGKIQLEDDFGELKNLEQSELNKLWLDGRFVIDENSLGASKNVFYLATPRDLKTFDERNQKLAEYRQQYLMRLDKHPGGFVFTKGKLEPILEEIAKELGDETPPKVGTVYSWWVKYRLTKCVTKLVDGRSRSGRKRHDIAYSLFEESVSEVYLTMQKEQGKAVFESIKTKIKRANTGLSDEEKIKIPGQATVYRWVKALHQYLVSRARLGSIASEKEFRAALKSLKVSRILERIEIDHTPLDIIVIDKKTMLPLGRPWLTLAIDRYSRMIVGFYICFHAPSSFSVMQCLKRAILPKDKWLEKYPDIKEVWPAHGIPELVATDNGMDLHSQAVEDICLEMGIEILYCPAGEPYYKGAIERMFRTLNSGLIHSLPGTVFSNIDARGDYPSEAVAAIDMETLLHLITKWVVEIYHRTVHKGIGMAPLTKWNEGASQKVIELPAYPQQLDVLVGIPAERTLFHYGVEHDCLRYNSPELQHIRSRVGGTPIVPLKFYEDAVDYIHVFDEFHKEYIKVPAVNTEYAAGLTRDMHILIRAYTKKKYGNDYSDDQILESRNELKEIVAKAELNKKMGERKKSAVLVGNDSESLLSDDSLSIDTAQKAVTTKDTASLPTDMDFDDDLPDFGTSQKTGTHG